MPSARGWQNDRQNPDASWHDQRMIDQVNEQKSAFNILTF